MKLLRTLALFFPLTASATSMTIWQPGNGSNLNGDMWTTISGMPSSGAGIRNVQYLINGVSYCVTTSLPANCGYKTPAAPGTYTLTAIATDNNGVQGQTSINFTVGGGSIPTPAPVPSVPAPTVSFLFPSDNQRLDKNYWTTFTSTATNAVKVIYYVNGSKLCETSSGPYFNCSFNTGGSDAVVSVKSVAVNSAGATAEKSVSIIVGAGSPPAPAPVTPPPTSASAPVLSLVSPANNQAYQKNFWTTFTSTATNAVKVEYYVNGAKLCETTSGPYFNCSYNTGSMDAITAVRAVAYSSSGGSSEKSINIVVGSGSTSPAPVPVVMGPAPSVSIISPANNAQMQKNYWTTLTSTATNAAKVTYYVNGAKLCDVSAGPYFNCSWLTPNMDTTVAVKAVVTSASGSTAETSISVKIGAASAPAPSTNPILATGSTPPGYSLLWSDEFEDKFSGAPNPANWDYFADYVINGEQQCYTRNRRENVRVENRTSEGYANGYLVLQLRKEQWPCPQDNNKMYNYTSGAITTRKANWGAYLVNMPHGRYEIRAKIPSGRGTWPALWLVGDGPLGAWPNSGEIDIMEAVGFEEAQGKYVLHTTLHRNAKFGWPNQWGSTGQGMNFTLSEPPSRKFHTWTMEWTPDSLEFYIDGVRVTDMIIVGDQVDKKDGFYRYDFAGGTDPLAWPYSKEVATQFQLIFNLAWGGGWGGVAGLDDSIFNNGPVEFLVDYVRIYKKN